MSESWERDVNRNVNYQRLDYPRLVPLSLNSKTSRYDEECKEYYMIAIKLIEHFVCYLY